MAEWFKAAVLKTVDRKVRGFESYSLRQKFMSHVQWMIQPNRLNYLLFIAYPRGEVAELAEGARLLSVCRAKPYRGFESLPLRHPI